MGWRSSVILKFVIELSQIKGSRIDVCVRHRLHHTFHVMMQQNEENSHLMVVSACIYERAYNSLICFSLFLFFEGGYFSGALSMFSIVKLFSNVYITCLYPLR